MYKKIIFLISFCFFLGACGFNNNQKKQNINSYTAKAKNFAQVSSVFKIELDEKLGAGSSLLLFIDYDKNSLDYTVKILGAFSSVLLKARYDTDSFTYDFEPQILQNKQVKELFEQTIKVLISSRHIDKYKCSLNNCQIVFGTDMFKNKYVFSAYDKEGFAHSILCYYRRGSIKINLTLLKVSES